MALGNKSNSSLARGNACARCRTRKVVSNHAFLCYLTQLKLDIIRNVMLLAHRALPVSKQDGLANTRPRLSLKANSRVASRNFRTSFTNSPSHKSALVPTASLASALLPSRSNPFDPLLYLRARLWPMCSLTFKDGGQERICRLNFDLICSCKSATYDSCL